MSISEGRQNMTQDRSRKEQTKTCTPIDFKDTELSFCERVTSPPVHTLSLFCFVLLSLLSVLFCLFSQIVSTSSLTSDVLELQHVGEHILLEESFTQRSRDPTLRGAVMEDMPIQHSSPGAQSTSPLICPILLYTPLPSIRGDMSSEKSVNAFIIKWLRGLLFIEALVAPCGTVEDPITHSYYLVERWWRTR